MWHSSSYHYPSVEPRLGMRVSDPAILSRHFFAAANMPGKLGAVHFTGGFFCDEHGTRRLTPPTPNLGIARGLSGYRQIPLPQQFSQSKNSSLRRACAFCEVSRDYCILLPSPSPYQIQVASLPLVIFRLNPPFPAQGRHHM